MNTNGPLNEGIRKHDEEARQTIPYQDSLVYGSYLAAIELPRVSLLVFTSKLVVN